MKPRKFRIGLISCFLLTSFLLSSPAYAQDEELPNPGITPDSAFYTFDIWSKNIGMFFAFGPVAKARKALQYAEERLAEVRAMAVKNRVREMIRTANDYDGFMTMANERAEEARRLGATDNISEVVALATSKHLSVLDKLQDQAPEAARESIVRAREVSINGQENALRALARTNPERAIDISSAAVESQLERASVKAAENMNADVEVALDYAARIAALEEEIATIAQENGIDITAIEQRLAHSTSNRLEILARVYEKVPEKARAAVEKAIENSVRKYERAVDTLKEKDALGEIPEEAPALQRMQVEVRERLELRTANKAQVSGNISDNVSVQIKVQAQVKEQNKEQPSNLKPETPAPTVSDNTNSGKGRGT